MTTAGVSTGASIIYSPPKPDLSKWIFGDTITADILHYLRCRDDKAGFFLDVLIDDAFRGFEYVDPKTKESEVIYFENVIKRVVKWACEYGWSVNVHLENDVNSSKLRLAMNMEKSESIQGFHPFVNGIGGITNFLINNETGYPSKFMIKPNAQTPEIEIDASRCDIYTWGDETSSWQGYTMLGKGIDHIISLKLLLGTLSRRSRDYSTIRYLIQLLGNQNTPNDVNAPIPESVKDSIANALKDIPHTVVNGKVEIGTVGGPVSTTELGISVESSKESIATSGGVAKTDITGAEAGQKLSTDANQASYGMTMRNIQKHFLPFIMKTMARLGHPITGFKSGAELSAESRYDKLALLYNTYNSAPDELREPIALKIESFYKQEFGMEVKIKVMKNENGSGIGGGSESSGGKGGFGEKGSREKGSRSESGSREESEGRSGEEREE